MDKKALLALRYELEALTIDFWHEVDANAGRDAARFYTEDCVFTTKVQEYKGREGIAFFYQKRRNRGARTSFHVVQNFRIEVETEDRVHTHYICSLFAADGEPVLPSRPAIMMANSHELLIRQPDGNWLFKDRQMTSVFRDGTETTG